MNSFLNAVGTTKASLEGYGPIHILVGSLAAIVFFAFVYPPTNAFTLTSVVMVGALASASSYGFFGLLLSTNPGIKIRMWQLRKLCSHLSDEEVNSYEKHLREQAFAHPVSKKRIEDAKRDIEGAVLDQWKQIKDELTEKTTQEIFSLVEEQAADECGKAIARLMNDPSVFDDIAERLRDELTKQDSAFVKSIKTHAWETVAELVEKNVGTLRQEFDQKFLVFHKQHSLTPSSIKDKKKV